MARVDACVRSTSAGGVCGARLTRAVIAPPRSSNVSASPYTSRSTTTAAPSLRIVVVRCVAGDLPLRVSFGTDAAR